MLYSEKLHKIYSHRYDKFNSQTYDLAYWKLSGVHMYMYIDLGYSADQIELEKTVYGISNSNIN